MLEDTTSIQIIAKKSHDQKYFKNFTIQFKPRNI